MIALVEQLDAGTRAGLPAPPAILAELDALLTEAAEELQDGMEALLGRRALRIVATP